MKYLVLDQIDCLAERNNRQLNNLNSGRFHCIANAWPDMS